MLAIVVVIALIIGAVLIIASKKSSSFVVERKIAIDAPPEKLFPNVADFHRWTLWSPYEKIDPNLQRSYSGAESGIGAVYEWSGNSKVGKGRMEVIQADPPTLVKLKLDFDKPFVAHNSTTFTFQAGSSDAPVSTTVTWSMLGESPFFCKVMSLFVDMDKMVGKQFEEGLLNLKRLGEK